MKKWRDRIKILRLDVGMTQQEFAHRLGVALSTLTKWERGSFNPSKMAQEKICALEVKLKK